METEEEKYPETNGEADGNITEDAVEIDLEDEGLTELLGLGEEKEEEVEGVPVAEQGFVITKMTGPSVGAIKNIYITFKFFARALNIYIYIYICYLLYIYI